MPDYLPTPQGLGWVGLCWVTSSGQQEGLLDTEPTSSLRPWPLGLLSALGIIVSGKVLCMGDRWVGDGTWRAGGDQDQGSPFSLCPTGRGFGGAGSRPL